MLHRISLVCATAVLTSAVFAQTQQFQPLPRMSISTDADNAFGIATGDVNGDGAVDYVVANLSTAQSTKLYINDGNGNFTDMSSTLLPSALSGGSVAMGDIDRDGDLDIIIGTQNTSMRLQVFLNDGKGKFTDNTSKSISSQPTELFYDMKLGDVDFDRDLDLACAAASGTSSRLFLNDGKGVFTDATGKTFPSVGAGHWGVEIVDLGRDVDMDIVLHSSATKAPIILINTDFRGTFKDQSSTWLPSGFTTSNGRKVVGRDFNGDGYNDLFFGNYTTQNQLLLYDPTSSSAKFKDVTTTNMPSLSDNTYMLGAGDIDEDGDIDVLSGNWASAGIQNTLYLNDGKGKFSNATSSRYATVTDPTTVLALADVDGDGDLDAIVGNWIKQNQVVFNLHRHVYAPTQPAINTNYTLDFWSAPGYATLPHVVIPLVGLTEAKPHFAVAPFGGLLGIPLSGVVILPATSVAAPGGKRSLTFGVPNDKNLSGLKFYVQSLVGQTPKPIPSFGNLFPDQVK
jgi:hypothetical protein